MCALRAPIERRGFIDFAWSSCFVGVFALAGCNVYTDDLLAGNGPSDLDGGCGGGSCSSGGGGRSGGSGAGGAGGSSETGSGGADASVGGRDAGNGGAGGGSQVGTGSGGNAGASSGSTDLDAGDGAAGRADAAGGSGSGGRDGGAGGSSEAGPGSGGAGGGGTGGSSGAAGRLGVMIDDMEADATSGHVCRNGDKDCPLQIELGDADAGYYYAAQDGTVGGWFSIKKMADPADTSGQNHLLDFSGSGWGAPEAGTAFGAIVGFNLREPAAGVDVTMYAGVRFKAKMGTACVQGDASASCQSRVSVQVVDALKRPSGKKTVVLQTSWQTYECQWSDLPSSSVDMKTVSSIQFLTYAPASPFDYQLDDIEFIQP